MKTSLLMAWLGFLVLVVSGCQPAHSPSTSPSLPTANVKVSAVDTQARTAVEDVVGTVRSKVRATVSAKVLARIDQFQAVPGQPVKKGDILVILDGREIKARLDQAAAVREQTEAELKRFAALLEQKSATRQEFDAVQARQRVAQASVLEAETMLGYTQVRAPFDGVITRKTGEVGDLAAPGRPLLEIEDPTALRFEADIPEALIERIVLGARLPVRIGTLSPSLEGTVSEVSPAADAASRTFPIKLDLPAVPGLRAGLFGRVSVPIGETRAVQVPIQAVLQRGQLEMVFTVTNRHAQMRVVKTGKKIGDVIELVSGVDPGEVIVVENVANLRDGQPVESR